MTTAASVAFGIRPSIGASSSMVASAAPAVTSDAFCDRPPAARTTAVCDVPPPAGIAPNSAPPRLAAPVATSSRFALIGGSSGRAKARPAAIVSVKLISAIPSAPGTSCSISARIRQRERREALRNQADRRDAQRLQAEEPRRGDAAPHGDQRRRRVRPQPLHADQHRERRHGHRQRDQRGVGNVLHDAHEHRRRSPAW